MPHLDEGAPWVRATMPFMVSFSTASNFSPEVRNILLKYPMVTDVSFECGRPDERSAPQFTIVRIRVFDPSTPQHELVVRDEDVLQVRWSGAAMAIRSRIEAMIWARLFMQGFCRMRKTPAFLLQVSAGGRKDGVHLDCVQPEWNVHHPKRKRLTKFGRSNDRCFGQSL